MDSGMPLVSIGMPVYNGAQYIRRALDSLLAQDYDNYEIIISDNASTDQTLEILEEYALMYPQIRTYTQSENVGIQGNFRIVLRLARGEYFMWAADDDYWEPEFLKTLVNELESDPTAGVVQCAVRRENPDGSLKDIIRFEEKYNRSKFSHWQVALKLLSPDKKIKMLKYNLFICGLFKHKVIIDILDTRNKFPLYGERATLTPIALAYKFLYVDAILFSKTVHQEKFTLRYPNDKYKKTQYEMKDLRYHLKYYYKLTQCIINYSDIPLRRKLFVFFFFYYMLHRFVRKQKRKIKKKLFGKNSLV